MRRAPFRDAGGDPGLALPSLPSPNGHAARQREAIARLVLPAAGRLLWVDSLAGPLAVLREADGTVIDEEVAVVGAVRVGDLVLRLPVPGRGDRDAAGSYVAVGPVNPQRAAPSVTVGPAAGAAGAGATVGGTDAFCRVTVTTGASPATGVLFTLVWSVPRPTGTYGVFVSGRNAAGRDVVAGGIAQSGADTVQCPVACGVAPAASAQSIFNVLVIDG